MQFINKHPGFYMQNKNGIVYINILITFADAKMICYCEQ